MLLPEKWRLSVAAYLTTGVIIVWVGVQTIRLIDAECRHWDLFWVTDVFPYRRKTYNYKVLFLFCFGTRWIVCDEELVRD